MNARYCPCVGVIGDCIGAIMSAKIECTISRSTVRNQFDLQSTESATYCHGTINANSSKKRPREATPGIVYTESRRFHPVADNRRVPRRRAGHDLPRRHQ